MGDFADDLAISIPVLPSLDIAETKAFYETLGLSDIGYVDDDYLIVRRGRMEIHFWRTEERHLCETASCYIRGGEIVALHAEFKARNIARLSPLLTRPWNMLEFYIHDPHGNLLRFGCAPEEVSVP